MTIDLKWTLPFVTPVALLALLRVMWWLAGVDWDDNVAETSAFTATSLGLLAGSVLSVVLSVEAPDALKVRIGGGK